MILDNDALGAPTKADAAYFEIRNQILQGTLRPESRVDYASLSGMFGHSITPLREALRRLEADHLVIRNAHRDVIIAPLTLVEARDLLTVRQDLDLLAVGLAVENMTSDELLAARAMLMEDDDTAAIQYLRSAHVPVASGGVLTINRAFHRMIYCGSHNEVLIQYRDAISARAERYAILARRLKPSDSEPHRSLHLEIVVALENRDRETAERLTRNHDHGGTIDFVEVIFGPDSTYVGAP
jgi:DNA-binding GntR family transcriptional regulator